MSPGSATEKAEEATSTSDDKPAKSRFSLRKRQDIGADEKDAIHGDATEVDTPVSKELTPVSFSALFRYIQSFGQYLKYLLMPQSGRFATRFELFLDFVGLIAAAGAGAAQVCWTFATKGTLTDFVCNSHL